MQGPAVSGPDHTLQHRGVDRVVGPPPEFRVGFMMEAQELPGGDNRLIDPHREAFLAHPILNPEDALLAKFTLGLVCRLCAIPGDEACLLAESEVGITGIVGHDHVGITAQIGGDTKFLRRPINVSDAVARWWLDQTADPDAWPENKF